ncbi:MAG: ADP-ribosyltransferase [Pseudobdellovibrionaceae bacterium]
MMNSLFFNFILIISFILSVQSKAGVYDFHTLQLELGYAATDSWFGSSEKEIASLEDYLNKNEEYYTEINRFLRFYPAPYEWYGKGPDAAKVDVQNIDNIFKRIPVLPKDIILFRGVRLNWKKSNSFKVGEIFSDKAFASTSTDLKIADQFTYDDIENGASIYILYFNQSHAKGILIDQGENEVLLQHGQTFKVMDKNTSRDKTFYLIQVCGFSVCSKKVQQQEALSYWNSGQFLKKYDSFKMRNL